MLFGEQIKQPKETTAECKLDHGNDWGRALSAIVLPVWGAMWSFIVSAKETMDDCWFTFSYQIQKIYGSCVYPGQINVKWIKLQWNFFPFGLLSVADWIVWCPLWCTDCFLLENLGDTAIIISLFLSFSFYAPPLCVCVSKLCTCKCVAVIKSSGRLWEQRCPLLCALVHVLAGLSVGGWVCLVMHSWCRRLCRHRALFTHAHTHTRKSTQTVTEIAYPHIITQPSQHSWLLHDSSGIFTLWTPIIGAPQGPLLGPSPLQPPLFLLGSSEWSPGEVLVGRVSFYQPLEDVGCVWLLSNNLSRKFYIIFGVIDDVVNA